MIAGDHELCRGNELHSLIAESRRKAKEVERWFIFLEHESWTYTTPAGDPKISMNDAARRINDFRLISIRDQAGCRRLIPEDTVRLHGSARALIEFELAKPFDGKTVVVTRPRSPGTGRQFIPPRGNPCSKRGHSACKQDQAKGQFRGR
jgi:hypothetical protein